MPIEPNNYQKIAILNIEAGTRAFIEQKLQEGYLIQSITSLTPVYDKLLIVYSLNNVPEP